MSDAIAAAPCPRDLLAFAAHLADRAGAIARAARTGDPAVSIKPDGTPVTDLDRAIEAALRAEILRVFPEHGVLGEEFPPHLPGAEHLWILDPIDGTKEFLQGLPLWGTLIAHAAGGRLVLGLAEQPLTGDRFLGAEGHGARWNDRPVTVRACASLAEATISTMGYDSFCPAQHDRLAPLRARARAVITADSFLVFGLLAAGRVDAIVSSGFALHDFAALATIVRCAGGEASDWSGAPLGLGSGPDVLAAGDARLAGELRARLAGAV